jgi:uncharacterized membrane protein
MKEPPAVTANYYFLLQHSLPQPESPSQQLSSQVQLVLQSVQVQLVHEQSVHAQAADLAFAELLCS